MLVIPFMALPQAKAPALGGLARLVLRLGSELKACVEMMSGAV